MKRDEYNATKAVVKASRALAKNAFNNRIHCAPVNPKILQRLFEALERLDFVTGNDKRSK